VAEPVLRGKKEHLERFKPYKVRPADGHLSGMLGDRDASTGTDRRDYGSGGFTSRNLGVIAMRR